jgi:hypothetical protein
MLPSGLKHGNVGIATIVMFSTERLLPNPGIGVPHKQGNEVSPEEDKRPWKVSE